MQDGLPEHRHAPLHHKIQPEFRSQGGLILEERAGLTAYALIALCSSSLTPLHGKAASVALLASLRTLQSMSTGTTVTAALLPTHPSREIPLAVRGSGRPQEHGQDCKGSWCSREDTARGLHTSKRKTQLAKKKKKRFRECFLQGM